MFVDTAPIAPAHATADSAAAEADLPPGEDVGAEGVSEGDGPPTMRPPAVKGTQPKRDPVSGKFLRRGGGTTEVESEAEREEAPAPAQRFKRKLKIYGKEEEHEASEDDLWAAYRERSAAGKRFEESAKLREEAAKLREESETLVGKLKTSPMKLLIEQGNTPEQALDILQKEWELLIAEEAKSPAQRELEALRNDKAARERDESERGKKAATAEEEAAFQKEADGDAVSIGKALALSKLPKDDLTFEMMAKAYYSNKRNGIGLDEKELAAATSAQLGSHLDAILTGMSDDEVLDKFPKASKRITAALLARHKKRGSGGGAPRPKDGAPAPKVKDGPRIVTDAEMDEMYGIRRRG